MYNQWHMIFSTWAVEKTFYKDIINSYNIILYERKKMIKKDCEMLPFQQAISRQKYGTSD